MVEDGCPCEQKNIVRGLDSVHDRDLDLQSPPSPDPTVSSLKPRRYPGLGDIPVWKTYYNVVVATTIGSSLVDTKVM